MRIISGTYKGTKLKPPRLAPTRPTTDFAKEALFNILQNYWNFDAVSFLDLFAGTGGHSYEFASRGCTKIVTVEQDKDCLEYITETKLFLGFDAIRIVKSDVFRFIETTREQFDIIFAGPPYKLEKLDTLPDMIIDRKLLLEKGWFILEHNPQHHFESHPAFWMSRNYGTTIFSFFSITPPDA